MSDELMSEVIEGIQQNFFVGANVSDLSEDQLNMIDFTQVEKLDVGTHLMLGFYVPMKSYIDPMKVAFKEITGLDAKLYLVQYQVVCQEVLS